MKGGSQMGQARIMPDKEVRMRQNPGDREELHLLKHRWRFLASLAQARNQGVVCRSAQHKGTGLVGLDPCDDPRQQGWSATLVTTTTAGMDRDDRAILKYSQLSQSSLARHNRLVWNEQPPAIVPSRDYVLHRFHDPICLMNCFTCRRKRRSLDDLWNTQLLEHGVQSVARICQPADGQVTPSKPIMKRWTDRLRFGEERGQSIRFERKYCLDFATGPKQGSYLPACHDANLMVWILSPQSSESWQREEDVPQSARMDDQQGTSHWGQALRPSCGRRPAASLRANSRSAGVLTFRKDRN